MRWKLYDAYATNGEIINYTAIALNWPHYKRSSAIYA
jgi:hypothetical protein